MIVKGASTFVSVCWLLTLLGVLVPVLVCTIPGRCMGLGGRLVASKYVGGPSVKGVIAPPGVRRAAPYEGTRDKLLRS